MNIGRLFHFSAVKSTRVSSVVLDCLAEDLPARMPEARKATACVPENHQDMGVSTVQEIAAAGHLGHHTLVRQGSWIGLDGKGGSRAPFHDAIRLQATVSGLRAVFAGHSLPG